VPGGLDEREKASSDQPHPSKKKGSIFEGVSTGFSSLSLAYCLTEKASSVGFDWPDVKGF
jgi:uncharacterized protein YabN with tetrapyrrole methylase and pyrophosphatase domain